MARLAVSTNLLNTRQAIIQTKTCGGYYNVVYYAWLQKLLKWHAHLSKQSHNCVILHFLHNKLS